MLEEPEVTSRRRVIQKLTPVALGSITRLLRTVRDLKGKVYIVGGLVTEGRTVRDIDIVVSSPKDIPVITKALGKYGSLTHFIVQKDEPPASLFVKVTGKEGTTPDKFKGKGRIPKNEYAS
ncbi:hypothetical protein KAW50_02560 [candidate division WOR-3 bacterium]|nr:hypothetical protein [candidate division WOR-3 bacterium]